MTFDDIEKGVRQGWDFVIPPVSRAVLVVGVAHFVAPKAVSGLFETVAAHLSVKALETPELRAELEFYGIAKLAPVLTLIAILAVLQLFNTLFLIVGYLLPPFVTTVQPGLFLATASPSQVTTLWRANRMCHNVEELRAQIDAKFRALNESERWNWTHWSKSASAAHVQFNACKVYTMLAIAVVPVASWLGMRAGGEGGRAVLAVLVLVGAAAYWFFKILYATMQQEHDVIQVATRLSAAETPLHDGIATDAFISEQAARLDTESRWWRVRLVETHLVTWALHAVLTRRRPNNRLQPTAAGEIMSRR